MYTVTKFPHGTFSWADNSSTDVDKAKEFYLNVMGWSKEELPMGEGLFYTMFKQDGHNVAAISPMQPQMQEQGMPSHWNYYVTVDDVDAVASKVAELGGTLIAEPFDVFEDGRMAVVQDPTGGVLSLWQAKNSIGAYLVNGTGAMLWNELYTRDVDAAKQFYGALLGWEYQKMEGQEYWLIQNNGRMNGGIMAMDESWGETPPYWTGYYNVADIEDTVKKVEEFGGTIIQPIFEAGDVGRMIIISDPAGAALCLMQPNPGQAEPWLEHK